MDATHDTCTPCRPLHSRPHIDLQRVAGALCSS
ncbi:putative leader peptide [Streptomyces humidus]